MADQGNVADELGNRADDEVKYGVGGTFPKVAEFLNAQFKDPVAVGKTVAAWNAYVKDQLGGDADKHAFGKFASYLIKFGGGSAELPPQGDWDKDTTKLGSQPIDGYALEAIRNVVRKNLTDPKPRPMFFQVKHAPDVWHSIAVRDPADVNGEKGLEVTIYCPK